MAEAYIDNQEKVSKLWEMYQDGLKYQKTTGMSSIIPKCVKFYEGDQWPAPTKNTKNLPRPVVNIIKMICRSKKSAILATPIRLVYKSDDLSVNTEKFNLFADYMQKEIGQNELDAKAIDDGLKKGTYTYHYYWDTEANGKNGIKEGGLRCELVDVLDIFFANPTEKDEQKQDWILIASRENIKSVKDKADDDIDKDLICADDSIKNYNEQEQDGTELCTVLTRYFRQNGEVYCEKAVKSTIVNKAFSIAPNMEKAGKLLGFAEDDAPNNNLPDKDYDNYQINVKAELYPIVVGNYEDREKSIYGLSEVDGLIPNQKAINFNLAMYLLNCEQLAWGKWKVTPDALEGQVINNEPGQVLTDHSKTGDGIRRLEAQQLNSAPLVVIDKIMEYTRIVTGTTEVMTGEVISANMSGAAIAQLQSQAQQPIEELKKSFWRVKEKQGKVFAQFFKLFYDFDKTFSYSKLDKDKEEQVVDVFNGTEYANVDFSVIVEATAGTRTSAAGDINTLDNLLAKNLISLKTYLKAYPENAISNKTEIIKGIEDDERNELNQLKQISQQQATQLQQATQMLQQQKDTVDKVVSLIQENNRLRSMIANLYAESKEKILKSNEQIKFANMKINETTQDATKLAELLAQSETNIATENG